MEEIPIDPALLEDEEGDMADAEGELVDDEEQLIPAGVSNAPFPSNQSGY